MGVVFWFNGRPFYAPSKLGWESRVLRVNEQFWGIAKARAAEGRKIIVVYMHGPGGPQISDLADGTHPNDVGYAKMSNIWRRDTHEAVDKDLSICPV